MIKNTHSVLQKSVPLKIQVLSDGFLADKITLQDCLNIKSSLKWRSDYLV